MQKITEFDNWGDRLTIKKNVIDEKAVQLYSNGHCHSLAIAIHRATGWPMVGFFKRGESSPKHVAILLPDERILDIEGVRHEDDIHCSFDTDYWKKVLIKDVKSRFNGTYRKPSLKLGNYVKTAVINQIFTG